MSSVDTLIEVLDALKAWGESAAETVAGTVPGYWYGEAIGRTIDYFGSRPDAIMGSWPISFSGSTKPQSVW